MLKTTLLIICLVLITANTSAQDASSDGSQPGSYGTFLKFKPIGSSQTPAFLTKEESESKAKKKRSSGKTEVELSYAQESLSNGFANWKSASLSFQHRFSLRKVVYGRYIETERFGKRDRELLLGVYQPLNKDWTLFFEGNVSPTHNVLAKWSAMGQIERTVAKTWIVKAGYRRSVLSTAKANIFRFEGEKYWGNNRAAYTLSINNLENVGTSPSHRIQYSRYYGEQTNSINLSAAFGKELESLGELGVLQSNVKNFTVHGRHWVKRSWALSYGYSVHQQGNVYRRSGGNVGIRFKF